MTFPVWDVPPGLPFANAPRHLTRFRLGILSHGSETVRANAVATLAPIEPPPDNAWAVVTGADHKSGTITLDTSPDRLGTIRESRGWPGS